MALTVIATVGASNANSYATVAEADTYHEARLHAEAWTAATPELKAQAVVMATTMLDTMIEWTGWKATEAQALQWPRLGMVDRGGEYAIDHDVLPTDLVRATAELARQLLDADRTADNDVDAAGLKRVKAGSVELEFRDRIDPKVLPDWVVQMLPASWGRARGRASTMVTLQRA